MKSLFLAITHLSHWASPLSRVRVGVRAGVRGVSRVIGVISVKNKYIKHLLPHSRTARGDSSTISAAERAVLAEAREYFADRVGR